MDSWRVGAGMNRVITSPHDRWRGKKASVPQPRNFVFEIPGDHVTDFAYGVGDAGLRIAQIDAQHSRRYECCSLVLAPNAHYPGQQPSQPDHGTHTGNCCRRALRHAQLAIHHL